MKPLTRVITKNGTNRIVDGDVDEVRKEWAKAVQTEPALLVVTNVSAQELFPPERLYLRADWIESIQEVTEEAWAWQQHAEEVHYARQLEANPQVAIAEAQERLVKVLEDQAGDD